MSHQHAHHHFSPNSLNRALLAGIILNSVFVVIEFITGLFTNSLALLSDAGHNLSDVATLALSWFAFKVAQRKATAKYTFGFHRGTILASLANAVILLVAVGSIGWEAVQRFIAPEDTEGLTISVVAGIGIVVNTVSALFFLRDKENDLNAKGAFLHLALDAAVSAGVVIAGIIISATGLKWIDPFISLLIMAIVLYGTWGLLKESLSLSLDAVPASVDIEAIKTTVRNTEGVKTVYHVHVWAMSTSRNAMTAHLVLENTLTGSAIAQLKKKIKHELEHHNIQHATLETEIDSEER